MNDFQRRALDILRNSSYMASVIRPGGNPVGIEPFGYNIRIGSVAATIANGAAAQGLIQIQADSDFALTYMSGSVLNNAGAILTNPNVLMQITDTGSGKTFYSDATQFSLIVGSGGFPFLLSTPRLLPPNVNVKFDITNNTGVASQGVFISLQGARIYY